MDGLDWLELYHAVHVRTSMWQEQEAVSQGLVKGAVPDGSGSSMCAVHRLRHRRSPPGRCTTLVKAGHTTTMLQQGRLNGSRLPTLHKELPSRCLNGCAIYPQLPDKEGLVGGLCAVLASCCSQKKTFMSKQVAVVAKWDNNAIAQELGPPCNVFDAPDHSDSKVLGG